MYSNTCFAIFESSNFLIKSIFEEYGRFNSIRFALFLPILGIALIVVLFDLLMSSGNGKAVIDLNP